MTICGENLWKPVGACAVCVQSEDELPERLLGTCRFSHLDMDSGLFLDHEGKLHPRDAPESRQMRAATRARNASGKHKAS